MAISPQRLTIYLYSAHRTVIFAIAQLSCFTMVITFSIQSVYETQQYDAHCCHMDTDTKHPVTAVAVLYAIPSRTRWSWHRRTVQHSATVLSQWLCQERGMTCLPQSEPLRHCQRFVRNRKPFSSSRVFSDLSLPVA